MNCDHPLEYLVFRKFDFSCYRDMPFRADDPDIPIPYIPRPRIEIRALISCQLCGELLYKILPYVESDSDGIDWL